MIRKPQADWHRRDEGAAVRTVRTATAVATDSAKLARSGSQAVVGLVLFGIAIFWGSTAIGGGLHNNVGLGAMSALLFWLGYRAFVKARATLD
jgi:hypothetical protein